MIRATAVIAVLVAAAFVTATAFADSWSFVGTNTVASSPVHEHVAQRLIVVDDQPISDELIERVRKRFGMLVLPTRRQF